ncbi:retron system putative HNH endonuclease [Leucothrix arctica]|uniref:TIGR02646 family protein n=1 Tax=Leucothrix arctica TaxID=1481894 RepID=A0A317CGG1_9GAMM|nr:retron system putative HNH endonuclease [Leucothrix arctica]PWQ97261.1 TIGR02646 family protein [Leucothrix arctica]
MRFIDKQIVCKPLQRRRHNPPQTDTDAKKAWRRFNKQAIRKTCYKQQFGLCAYTELSLDDEQLGCHLEHIAPRSRYPERTFESTNIILASMDECYSGQLETHEQFGGHFKSALYGDDWFIGPFDPRCELFFQYCATTGRVFANDKIDINDQANTARTIEVLNLNCDYLITKRRDHLRALTEAINSLMSRGSQNFNTEETNFESLRRVTLEKVGKSLPVFYSAKKQLFDKYKKDGFSKNHPPLNT